MLQAGMLATAAIVAMEQMLDRLAEDHSKARLLADILSDVTAIFRRVIDDIWAFGAGLDPRFLNFTL